MQEKEFLYEVPVISNEFETEAFFCRNSILYSYLKEGVNYRSGIRFHKIKEYAHHSEVTCQGIHVEDVYDILVEVKLSEWVKKIHEMTLDYQIKRSESWTMNHYMIYLEGGCFEVIAESWEVLPEEEGSWNYPS
jgi:hypothetical protein